MIVTAFAASDVGLQPNAHVLNPDQLRFTVWEGGGVERTQTGRSEKLANCLNFGIGAFESIFLATRFGRTVAPLQLR